jgi:rubrerythrin
MAIEDRNLPVGTRLVANYKKQTYVCTVEAGEEEGSLAFVLEDGSRHKSPSAAGSKVMGGKSVNGWRFWSLEGAAPARAEKAPKPEKAAKTPSGSRGHRKASKSSAAKKAKSTATLYRMKDQENVPEGKALWFCRGCMDGFLVEGEDEPNACPQGHSNDDPELNAPSGITSAQEAEVTA